MSHELGPYTIPCYNPNMVPFEGHLVPKVPTVVLQVLWNMCMACVPACVYLYIIAVYRYAGILYVHNIHVLVHMCLKWRLKERVWRFSLNRLLPSLYLEPKSM